MQHDMMEVNWRTLWWKIVWFFLVFYLILMFSIHAHITYTRNGLPVNSISEHLKNCIKQNKRFFCHFVPEWYKARISATTCRWSWRCKHSSRHRIFFKPQFWAYSMCVVGRYIYHKCIVLICRYIKHKTTMSTKKRKCIGLTVNVLLRFEILYINFEMN